MNDELIEFNLNIKNTNSVTISINQEVLLSVDITQTRSPILTINQEHNIAMEL